jgi:hypothetical protein
MFTFNISRLLPVKENFLTRQVFKVMNFVQILRKLNEKYVTGKQELDQRRYCRGVQFV